MIRGLRTFGFVTGLSASALAYGQTELVDLGLLPDGRFWKPSAINADGTVIVGVTTRPTEAVRWTLDGGAQVIGIPAWARSSEAMAVSGDGTTIVGDASDAFAWTEDDGFLNLGVLPGYLSSFATDTNADGSVVVGYCNTDVLLGAYRWTATEGMVDLGTLMPGDEVQAFGVSADGSIVVGSSGGWPFRWTEGVGMEAIEPTQDPIGGDVCDVSDDGQVIAMNYRHIWTEGTGYEYIGLADGANNNEIFAISGDGRTVVGENSYPGPRDEDPLLWRRDIGAVSLPDYLDGLGVDVSGWTLRRAIGVSADGSAIIGLGSIEGGGGGFLVRGLPVPASCPADIDGDGSLTLFDFLAFQNLFDAGDLAADFDGDGELTIFDFLAFQNAFDAGCP